MQELEPVAKELDLTMAQLAVAWVLQNDNVAAALVGASRPEQVSENVKAAGVTIPDELMTRIDEALGDVVVRDPSQDRRADARGRASSDSRQARQLAKALCLTRSGYFASRSCGSTLSAISFVGPAVTVVPSTAYVVCLMSHAGGDADRLVRDGLGEHESVVGAVDAPRVLLDVGRHERQQRLPVDLRARRARRTPAA